LSKPWRAAPLYRQESFFVGEVFSLDHRGWKAAPTEKAQLTWKKVRIMVGDKEKWKALKIKKQILRTLTISICFYCGAYARNRPGTGRSP
jgi:hypothetical protein